MGTKKARKLYHHSVIKSSIYVNLRNVKYMNRIKGKVSFLIIFALLIVLILTGCFQKELNIEKGLNYLREGNLERAKEIFNFIINYSNVEEDKTISKNSLGWIYFLEDNFFNALLYFNECSEYPHAKIGKILVFSKTGSINEALYLAEGVTSDYFPVEYLPDTLYEEEFIKLLLFLSIKEGEEEEIKKYLNLIDDDSFKENVELFIGDNHE